jgi:hypothetical protein
MDREVSTRIKSVFRKVDFFVIVGYSLREKNETGVFLLRPEKPQARTVSHYHAITHVIPHVAGEVTFLRF